MRFLKRISGTTIDAKFSPPYTFIYMDEVKTAFLQTQRLKPLVWPRYIDDTLFIFTHGEENLYSFMKDFNNFKFTIEECDRYSINFLDLNMKLSNDELTTSAYIQSTDRHQYLH